MAVIHSRVLTIGAMKDERVPHYLLRKVAGSRARHTVKPDYCDTRSTRGSHDMLDAPSWESMRRSGHTYLDTTPVKRWLYSQVEHDFDGVYSEFLQRIQPKYRDGYRDCIFWYTIRKECVEITEQGLLLIHPPALYPTRHARFYVDPATNRLRRIPPERTFAAGDPAIHLG